MSVEKDTSYIYHKVFKKAKYNEKMKRYVIKKEDYEHLNLSNRQLSILRKMCELNNVKLEGPSASLSSVENEELFKLYNQIKTKLSLTTDPKEKAKLEEVKKEIRNKIVTDNLKFVRTVIDKKFPGIHRMPNKEDIYQFGYEILLKYIESRDITHPKVFTSYIASQLVPAIERKLLYENESIGLVTKEALTNVNQSKSKANGDIKNISQETGLKEKRVEEILNLENLLETVSIDEELEKLNELPEQSHHKSLLYDNSFEEEVIKQTLRDVLIKLISTLPTQQRDLLMLKYGFIDGNYYKDIEIANLHGVTKAAIGKLKQDALNNLKTSIRTKYLVDYYEPSSSHQIKKHDVDRIQAKNLEETIIESIGKEELDKYSEKLSEKEKEVISLYLGFKDGKKYELSEISKITGYDKSYISIIKRRVFEKIKETIIEQNNLKESEYYDYLLQTYIMNKNFKRKH